MQADAILKSDTSWDAGGDGKLNVSGSGFFTKETGEMKALRKLYQNTPGSLYERNGYDLFITGWTTPFRYRRKVKDMISMGMVIIRNMIDL